MQLDIQSTLRTASANLVEQSGTHGLILAPNAEREAIVQFTNGLAKALRQSAGMRDSLLAWLADTLVATEGTWKVTIKDLAEAAGVAPGALRIAKLTCRRIPLLRRRNTLSWTHHVEVASACEDLEQIEEWLTLAETEHLSSRQLRARIRASRRESKTPTRKDAGAVTNVLALLRELRAADRCLRSRRTDWESWKPQARQHALREIENIVYFVDAMRGESRKGNKTPSG